MIDPDNITGKYILNDFGIAVPCPDLHKWAKWYEQNRESVHKTDEVCGLRISTVFLALDHSFGTDGPPILWETMVFADVEQKEQQWRFSYQEDAYQFHDGLVAGYKERLENTTVTLPTNKTTKPQSTD